MLNKKLTKLDAAQEVDVLVALRNSIDRNNSIAEAAERRGDHNTAESFYMNAARARVLYDMFANADSITIATLTESE